MEGDGSLDPPTHPEEGGSNLGSSKVRGSRARARPGWAAGGQGGGSV